MMMIIRDVRSVLDGSILTAQWLVMLVDGEDAGAVVIVKAQGLVMDQAGGLVIMMPITSHRVTDMGDKFLD